MISFCNKNKKLFGNKYTYKSLLLLFRKVIMISSKFSLFKDLEQLQINRCQTDICLVAVGAGGVKVFMGKNINSIWSWVEIWKFK